MDKITVTKAVIVVATVGVYSASWVSASYNMFQMAGL